MAKKLCPSKLRFSRLNNPNRKAVLARIKILEGEIFKAHEYLESGAHARWHKFKPLFKNKVKDNRELPPHKDCVKNVFLRGRERAQQKAKKHLKA